MKRLLTVLIGLSIVSACGTSRKATPTNEILSIVHGTSFGHCRGYCIKEIRYEPGSITFTQFNRDSLNFPKKVYVEHLTQNDYTALTATIEQAKWQQLDSVIACPDCADRGAEYLIITTLSGRKKVLYDAYTNPEGMEPLLKLIREKRKILEKELTLEEE